MVLIARILTSNNCSSINFYRARRRFFRPNIRFGYLRILIFLLHICLFRRTPTKAPPNAISNSPVNAYPAVIGELETSWRRHHPQSQWWAGETSPHTIAYAVSIVHISTRTTAAALAATPRSSTIKTHNCGTLQAALNFPVDRPWANSPLKIPE